MQGYKDWKDGLITTDEMLAGKVFREAPSVRKMWEGIFARLTGNWDKVPHHHLCCCDKCAPTEKDRKIKIALHNAEMEQSLEEFIDHDLACCCDQCLADMEKGMQEMEEMLEPENLAPSDCEPE